MLNTVFLLLVPVLGGFTPGDARIELSGGHARLICGERIVTLLSASGPTRAAGRSQLEAGASSALRLSWPGEASLRITGAASCEWDPGTDPPGARGESTDPSRPTSTGSSATNGQALSPATPWDRESDTRVVFHDLTAVDLELRREGLRVTVPGGWSSRLERGAYHLSRRGGGPVRCEHLAGRSITWDGPRGARLMVHAGEVVSLEEQWEEKIGHAGNELASAGPGQDQGEHHAWEDASWPWKRLARGPDQASGELERREQHVAVEPIPGAPQPAPGPPTLPPTVSEEAAPESSTTLEQVPEQMPEPMPEAAPAEDLTWFPSWGAALVPGRTQVSGEQQPAGPEPPAAEVTLEKSQEPEVETTLPVVLPPAGEPPAGETWIPTWGEAADPEAATPLSPLTAPQATDEVQSPLPAAPAPVEPAAAPAEPAPAAPVPAPVRSVPIEAAPAGLAPAEPAPVAPALTAASGPFTETTPTKETPPEPEPEVALQEDLFGNRLDNLDLVDWGLARTERAAGLEVRALGSGRWKFLLDRRAPQQARVYGISEDYLLSPGAVLVLDAAGNYDSAFGTVGRELVKQ